MSAPPVRVLFCRSNPVAPDPRVEKEARALLGAGYAVAVVGWDRSAALPETETFDGLTIHRLPIRAQYGAGLGNLPALIRWQAGLLFWLVRNHRRYDVIHACDFDTILPALCMQMWLGKKVVYDIFDFYADHLRRTPGWVKRLIRAVDYWAIARSDAVIIVDEARRAQIDGAQPRRLEIIYNAPEDIPGGTPPQSEGYPAGADFRLAYIGLLQVERGLFEMLRVLERHPRWGLAIAGFGGDEQSIHSYSQRLPNVSYLGRVPYQTAISLSLAADALFATYDPAVPNHRYSSPNKVFEAMMLGKPIIVCHDTNTDAMITASECGLVVPYGDEMALENALKQLAQDPLLRKRMGENARRAYERHYGWHIMQARLLNLYRELPGSS